MGMELENGLATNDLLIKQHINPNNKRCFALSRKMIEIFSHKVSMLLKDHLCLIGVTESEIDKIVTNLSDDISLIFNPYVQETNNVCSCDVENKVKKILKQIDRENERNNFLGRLIIYPIEDFLSDNNNIVIKKMLEKTTFPMLIDRKILSNFISFITESFMTYEDDVFEDSIDGLEMNNATSSIDQDKLRNMAIYTSEIIQKNKKQIGKTLIITEWNNIYNDQEVLNNIQYLKSHVSDRLEYDVFRDSLIDDMNWHVYSNSSKKWGLNDFNEFKKVYKQDNTVIKKANENLIKAIDDNICKSDMKYDSFVEIIDNISNVKDKDIFLMQLIFKGFLNKDFYIFYIKNNFPSQGIAKDRIPLTFSVMEQMYNWIKSSTFDKSNLSKKSEFDYIKRTEEILDGIFVLWSIV